MEIALIGLARSGKTTLFNALTGSGAEIGGYGARGVEPNIAVVTVPDPRLDRLVAMFDPKKRAPASITIIDVAGIEPSPEGTASSVDDSLLHAVAGCDALMAVIRGFEQGGIPPDADADLKTVLEDLILSDLARVEKRIQRIEKFRNNQPAEAKKALDTELAVLGRCKSVLEGEKTLRSEQFNADEDKLVRSFQFMTLKPMLIVMNEAESRISQCSAREDEIRAGGLPPHTGVVACCAQSELEISAIQDEAERREFLETFGIAEPMSDRVIRLAYEIQGLISFFTCAPKEVHAWTLRRGSSALQAAGTIHSDLERGFIRAQVIGCEELFRCGSMAEAKKKGVLRVEGKNDGVANGDVIEIRFSV